MDYDDIRKLFSNLTKEFDQINSKTKTSFKRTIDTEDIRGVIDISLDNEPAIPKEDFSQKPVIKDYRYWILKLDRYYKNSATRVNQINTQALKMYANLADKLESELNKEGITVARLVSKLRRESVNYDIYYTLYKLAETTVINHYNPLSTKTTDRSFKILEAHTSSKIRQSIEIELTKLEKSLKPADKSTREYFNLTENNKISLWWDVDGSLREKYDFSSEQERAINQISKRNNVVWKNQKVYALLIDMFLATMSFVYKDESIDNQGLINMVKPYRQSKDILDSILIYTESKIRSFFSFFSRINDNKAIEIIKAYDDGILYNKIKRFQFDFLENLPETIVNEIFMEYLDANPNKYQDLGNFLERLDTEKQIEVLEKYKNRDNFDKIIDHLIKWQSWSLGFIPLYYAYKMDMVKPSYEKILFEMIHKDNIDEFKNLVTNNELDSRLIDQFYQLEEKKAKKITMNRQKIADSKDDLKSTVDLVNDFLDEEESDEIIEEKEEKDKIDEETSTLEYKDIIISILENGFMPTDELSRRAMENGLTTNIFLNNINDSLYDYIGDQTLIIEGDRVLIDEFYVDMVKEIIDDR